MIVSPYNKIIDEYIDANMFADNQRELMLHIESELKKNPNSLYLRLQLRSFEYITTLMEWLINRTTATVRYTNGPVFLIYRKITVPMIANSLDVQTKIESNAAQVKTYRITDIAKVLEHWNQCSDVYIYVVQPIPGDSYHFRYCGIDKT